MGRRAGAVRAALMLAVVVLGSSSGCGTGRGKGEGAGGGTDDAAATALVEEYVRAVASGDADLAMSLRCGAARVPPEQRGHWKDQAGRFHAAGRIDGAAATVTPSTGLQPEADLPGLVHVSYAVSIDGVRRRPLLAVTGLEDGERRICGIATPAAGELHERFQAVPEPQPETALEPKDLMPATPPAGFRQVEDRAEPPRPGSPGDQGGWTRAWQTGDYGGIRVGASRFDTQAHAVDEVRRALRAQAGDSVAAIVDPAMPYALGTRVAGYAWLGVQPPDVGPYVDWVFAVFGRTLLTVAVADLPTGSGHETALSLMRSMAAMAAASPGSPADPAG